MPLSNPLLVISDLHLSHHTGTASSQDLARVVARHAGHELVLAGDVFDLSVDPPEREPEISIAALLDVHADLRTALRRHVIGGGKLTLIAGNHDAGIVKHAVRDCLTGKMELNADAPVSASPWFVRRGGVHIEHGHFYDPDNAPAHPLSAWSPKTEPLGVALTRRFLAPSGALAFAHAHETTPLRGLARSCRLFGVRTPWIIARYFATAIALTARARHVAEDVAREQASGQARLPAFAREVGLPIERLQAVLDGAPEPTHHDLRETFMRLYFDRIIAFLMLTGGLGAGVLGSAPGLVSAGLGAGYLALSVRGSDSRYSGLPEQRLRDAAELVRRATDAQLVLFGHTHCEDEAPGYLNLGSFSFVKQASRPYVVVDEHGEARRLRVA